MGRAVGINSAIGCRTGKLPGEVHPIAAIPELDLDPEFLARFSAEELMQDRFTFLHAAHSLNPNGKWTVEEETPLWNFNLHYFEFLFPLWNAFRISGDSQYLQQAVRLMTDWIEQNPLSGGGTGWESYTTALRVTNWLSFLSIAWKELPSDFRSEAARSLHEQYRYLSTHLEKDILGNHYLEDLKALVLCAVFFQDEPMLRKARNELLKECGEEILEDGMHFELSMTYHNLILEGLIRTAAALREYGQDDPELEQYIRKMLDAAWSMEESTDRIPLFNDSGNNAARSLSALVSAAKNHLQMTPEYRTQFPDAGYYIFQRGKWKMIVDAGQPGPAYIPGHAHCDALSFELYRDGKPAAVNCGTYAYQTGMRDFFRGTSAHNTVKINGREQSECWGVFRMAGRSRVRVLDADETQLRAEMTDCAGQTVRRTFRFGKELTVADETEDGGLTGYLHLRIPMKTEITCGHTSEYELPYAEEYGERTSVRTIEYQGEGRICLRIRLDDERGAHG